jgi:hypothetical protein
MIREPASLLRYTYIARSVIHVLLQGTCAPVAVGLHSGLLCAVDLWYQL